MEEKQRKKRTRRVIDIDNSVENELGKNTLTRGPLSVAIPLFPF